MLIFGLFAPIDLIIFSVGAGLTVILMLSFQASTINDVFMVLTPLLISTALVLPVPNHRNVDTCIKCILFFIK